VTATSAVRARAAVTVEEGQLRVLRSDPPLTLRDTPDGLHLVGSAAGPLAGDDLQLAVDVGARSSLVIRSTAASIALPGVAGGHSTFVLQARVGESACFSWQPEPTIAAAGCDHRVAAAIDLRAGARLVWRDEVVLGRHAEPSGSHRQRLRIDREGRPLLRSELGIGPAWPAWSSPAVLGDVRSVATAIVVGAETGPLPEGTHGRAARFELAADVTMVTVLGDRPGQAIRLLDEWMEGAIVAATARR
jgi:urease accessory protein